MANSEKKINALDIVSARSLGSLASVEGMFKGKKQQLTSYATFAIIVGSVAGLLFGFDQNLLNQVLNEPDFREAMSMPQAVDACGPGAAKEPMWVANRLGLIQSLYAIGCAFASPFAGAINDRLGRYKTLWVGLLIFFVGASLQTAASGYAMLMAGRLVAGASVGVLSSVVPVYIGELAPHHLRGGLGSLFQVGITGGALFSSIWCYIIQAALPPSSGFTWRIEVCFQLVFGLAMGVCMLFIPESPRWLCKSGQTDKARQVLKKLRGETSEEVTDAEMREIEVEVELESTYTGGVKDLFTKEVRLATMVALVIPIMQQFTGVNVLMGFSSIIFDGLCMNGSAVTLAQNVVNFVATWTAVLFFADRVGRKKMLIGTSAFIFLIWLIGCIVMWTIDINTNHHAVYGIAVLNCIYVATFAVAWGPNGWVIPNEVLPLRLRGKGSGFATFNNFFFNFIVSYTAPIAQSSIGFAGNMMIYACLMLLSCPALWLMMPETKGVPLEEMEAKFNKPIGEYVKANATDLVRRKKAVAPEPESKV